MNANGEWRFGFVLLNAQMGFTGLWVHFVAGQSERRRMQDGAELTNGDHAIRFAASCATGVGCKIADNQTEIVAHCSETTR